MKFGKRLQIQLDETLPEWKDKYLSYKRLKKRVKLISPPDLFAGFAEPALSPTREGPAFVQEDAEVRGPSEERKEAQDRVREVRVRNEPAILDGAATTVDSQGSSVNGAPTVYEDAARKSSTVSDAGTLPETEFEAIHMGNLTAEEADFIYLLNAELEKFNTFFIEKEEEYVIRLQALKERIERVKEESGPNGTATSESDLNEEMIKIRKDFVNFHGEMVLLENYSSLNYTGLVKILKKHDKRTGALLRMPFIQNVLHQPFFTTELLSKLVRECEMTLQSLFPSASIADVASTFSPSASIADVAPTSGSGDDVAQTAATCEVQQEFAAEKDGSQGEAQGQSFFHGDEVENIYKSTMAALKTIKELRKGSSTYNVFSLPPCSRGDGDEVCPIGLEASLRQSYTSRSFNVESDLIVHCKLSSNLSEYQQKFSP